MEQIVELLAGINPLLGVLGAAAIFIISYLAKQNQDLTKENRDLRSQYTSDLKENIESMVEINHTIRNFMARGDVKTVENKLDSLSNIINSINATLASLERRLNSLN